MRIGIDASILLRTLLDDHEQQATASRKFLAGLSTDKQGYVGVSALLEVFWVLNGRNRVPRGRVVAAFSAMLSLAHVEYEGFDCIKRALNAYADDSADFPDALLAARNSEAGCVFSMTFDKRAAERIAGTELLA